MIVKINDFRGDLTDVSAKTKALLVTLLESNLSGGVGQAGFAFYAPRAGAARRTGVWPFWAVQRSSEVRELSSLRLCIDYR